MDLSSLAARAARARPAGRRFSAAALALAGALVSACAAAPMGLGTETEAGGDTSAPAYDALARELGGQRAALFVNPCVLREEVRDNFVVTSDSQAWGTRVGTTVLAYLNDHGLPAGPLQIPLICAQGRTDTTARAAENRRGARGAVSLPIATDPALAPELQDAFQTLYAAIGRAAEPDALFPAAAPPATRFRLAADDRARLEAAAGGRYAWVLSLTASDVSKTRLFNQRFLARVAPALAGSGPGQGQAFSYYELGLVDLDTATVLFKRAAGKSGPLSAPGLYGQPWAAQLLGPVAGGGRDSGAAAGAAAAPLPAGTTRP